MQDRIKWIDACRPGRDDLSAKEMQSLAEHLRDHPEDRALFDHIQDIDAAIASTMHEVPVPDGLAERIVHSLEANQANRHQNPQAVVTPASHKDASLKDAQVTTSKGVVVKSTIMSSKMAWVAAGITAAAIVVVGCFLLPGGIDNGLTEQVAVTEAHTLYKDEMAAVLDGPLQSGRGDLPPSAEIERRFLKGWKNKGEYTVYALRGGNVRGALFVRKLQGAPQLSNRPNPHRAGSGDLWGTAWQSDGLLYVLVIRGAQHDRKRVQSFLVQFDTT